MTFERFEKIVNKFRPDVKVSKHGDFCVNKSRNTLGIIFLKNGKESKVYNFSGTYIQILEKLNIKVVTREEYDGVKQQLEIYKKENGTEDIFFGFTIDNTNHIKELEELIKEFDSDKYVRLWEKIF